MKEFLATAMLAFVAFLGWFGVQVIRAMFWLFVFFVALRVLGWLFNFS